MFKSFQEAYDKTCDHLAQQKTRAMQPSLGGATERCAYRSENGLMCAVGCHLPDGEWMEASVAVKLLIERHPELVESLFIEGIDYKDNIAFWVEMQYAHDIKYADGQSLTAALASVAANHDLIPRTIEEWTP